MQVRECCYFCIRSSWCVDGNVCYFWCSIYKRSFNDVVAAADVSGYWLGARRPCLETRLPRRSKKLRERVQVPSVATEKTPAGPDLTIWWALCSTNPTTLGSRPTGKRGARAPRAPWSRQLSWWNRRTFCHLHNYKFVILTVHFGRAMQLIELDCKRIEPVA